MTQKSFTDVTRNRETLVTGKRLLAVSVNSVVASIDIPDGKVPTRLFRAMSNLTLIIESEF